MRAAPRGTVRRSLQISGRAAAPAGGSTGPYRRYRYRTSYRDGTAHRGGTAHLHFESCACEANRRRVHGRPDRPGAPPEQPRSGLRGHPCSQRRARPAAPAYRRPGRRFETRRGYVSPGPLAALAPDNDRGDIALAGPCRRHRGTEAWPAPRRSSLGLGRTGQGRLGGPLARFARARLRWACPARRSGPAAGNAHFSGSG